MTPSERGCEFFDATNLQRADVATLVQHTLAHVVNWHKNGYSWQADTEYINKLTEGQDEYGQSLPYLGSLYASFLLVRY